jgi:AcrR family transcriptional regulator
MNQAERSCKRADAVTNRARVREAALAVFAQSGLDLEVNDIASQAQVGVGTLYRHFGNREDLLRAIVTDVFEDALAQLRLAVEPHMDDPRAALEALVSAGLRVQQQYRSLFAVSRDPRLTKLLDPARGEARRAQFLDQAKGVIERGIHAGLFREDLDPELVAATIIGSFASVFDHFGKSAPLAELEQRLFQLLWAMVAKEGGNALPVGSPLIEPGSADR